MTNPYLIWSDNQLTLHLEYRDVLAKALLPYITKIRDDYLVQGWTTVNPAEAIDALIDEVNLIKVGDGWLAYSVNIPWFSPEKMVCEEFVANVSLTDAVAAFTAVAKAEGATRLLVGTRAAPNGKHFGLAKRYEQQGLSVSTIELTMEIPHE